MTHHPFLTSKKPFSVNFASPADTGRVVDGLLRVLPFYLKGTNPAFASADNVSNLDKRREPNAQVHLEYGRESGYARPFTKCPVKPAPSVSSLPLQIVGRGVNSVAKLPKLTLLSVFTEQLFLDTRLNQVSQINQFTKSIKKNLFMQNKPNLCLF